MIIVDTNVWIDHFRQPDATLIALLTEGRPRIHPFVLGELALGSLQGRGMILKLVGRLQPADVARPNEVLKLIATEALSGMGVGYVDVHLLASALLMPGTKIWTRDKRLAAVADRLNLSFQALH